MTCQRTWRWRSAAACLFGPTVFTSVRWRSSSAGDLAGVFLCPSWNADRRGPRFSIIFGAILTSGGYLLLATTASLWQWYVFNSILAVFRQMMFFMPFGWFWFEARRGPHYGHRLLPWRPVGASDGTWGGFWKPGSGFEPEVAHSPGDPLESGQDFWLTAFGFGFLTWNLGTPQTPLKGRMRCWASRRGGGKAAKGGCEARGFDLEAGGTLGRLLFRSLARRSPDSTGSYDAALVVMASLMFGLVKGRTRRWATGFDLEPGTVL